MQGKANIDHLAPQKSNIDFSKISGFDFDVNPEDFKLAKVFDDIILVEYVDENDEGEVMRGNIVLPENMAPKAWRKAQVILCGPHVHQCEQGDIVVFPNDRGMAVTNLEVEGYGRLKKGMFLNERRLLGVCGDGSKSRKSS